MNETTPIATADTHRVWKLGSDIDTEPLAPGAYIELGIDAIAAHCLEAIRPDFAAGVRPGDVVVAGSGFGIGSSREQAPAALVRLGVAAVIAPSYSGLFFRNAFNVGLILLTCERADEIAEGDRIALDADAGTVTTAAGERLACAPIPGFLLAMARAGGLLNTLKLKLADRPKHEPTTPGSTP